MFTTSRNSKHNAIDDDETTFWNGLLKGNARSSEEAKNAIAYCRDAIAEYDEWFVDNEASWVFWQRVIIVGGVIATLSGVITIPESWSDYIPWARSLGWLRGVPAGIVTIAAGFLSSFTFKEDAVRNELTANALRNELIKFLCSADPYAEGESKDTSRFVNTICSLIDHELQSWRALVVSTEKADSRQHASSVEPHERTKP